MLLLLPSDSNKLLMQWKGPFVVTSKIGEADYKIEMGGKSRIFHANMLKAYIARAESSDVRCANVIFEGEDQVCQDMFCTLESKESVKDVQVDERLSSEVQEQVRQLLGKYSEIFTDLPGRTTLTECRIKMVDARRYARSLTLSRSLCVTS